MLDLKVHLRWCRNFCTAVSEIKVDTGGYLRITRDEIFRIRRRVG